MVNLIFKIMTHPKLERFRVWIPYPIYVAIITGLITTPFILFLIPKGPLSVLQLFVVPLAFPSLLAVASFTG